MKLLDVFRKQAIAHWIELALLVFFAAGSLILINLIAVRHNHRIDLTPEKRYTLADQTVQVLGKLAGPLRATVFYRAQEKQELQDVLELFSRASEKFAYELLDLEKNPARAEALGIKGYGAGIMEYAGRREKMYSVNEDGLLTALLKLTENREKTVRFVKGHGEKEIAGTDTKTSYSLISRALQAENYRVEELLLMQAQTVPADTQVLIIAGPEKDFLPREIDMIDTYLKSGGRVLLLCDPYPLPAIENYLKEKQIQLSRDFLIDTQSKLMALDHLTPIIVPDKRHPIARNMNEAIVFPVCRSVVPLEQTTADVLALSSQESWAETDTQSVRSNTISFNPGQDMRGPVPVAVLAPVDGSAVDGKAPPQGMLIVMGNSAFATNHYSNILGNKDFFLNTVNWLAEKSGMLSARSKSGGAPISMFFLTELQSKLVFWSAVVIEPSLVLLIGIMVVAWRRFKR
ncbi:MAG: Gldg family protein [Deltaproteobacteria bacterium]|nr:Gldg family protein [Deltaproteobacteria bacterium]